MPLRCTEPRNHCWLEGELKSGVLESHTESDQVPSKRSPRFCTVHFTVSGLPATASGASTEVTVRSGLGFS